MSEPTGSARERPELRQPRMPAIGVAAIVTTAALVLRGLGRVAWCSCGSLRPDSWDVTSLHNSQHLIDPYSFSHVQHGLVFYGALWPLRRRIGAGPRLVIAVAVEALWEILENTPAVIDRYREVTASYGYYGDSIPNSLADIGACILGYALARRLSLRWAVAVFVAIEASMILWIRDSLLLNVLMLLWPIDAVRAWQSAVS